MGTEYDLGLIGLGVMGRNLALNLADHGFSVAGYFRDPAKAAAFRQTGAAVDAFTAMDDFLANIRRPRAILLLVTAGAAVDQVIDDLIPRLDAGDLIIDGGNSHFRDTERRHARVEAQNLLYMGLGVSGGEAGARRGPAMMPGASPIAYERVRPMLEAAAAKVDGEPCVALIGPRSAGHYVKMMHNGIEYGLLQLIAEVYDLLHRGLGLANDEIAAIFEEWHQGESNSYLLGITIEVLRRVDPDTGKPLVDLILDQAAQKGTGSWASQDAFQLHVPTPTIDVAVAMRNLSSYKQERVAGSQVLGGQIGSFEGDRGQLVAQARAAFWAASVITYAQGFHQMAVASRTYDYGLDFGTIARIWRGGCIVRARLLEDIRQAFAARPDLPSLLLDPTLGRAVAERQQAMRAVVGAAVALGIPAPALSVSLAYFDGFRSERLPANLIQAQRDYFGAHTYQRIDKPGTFHTEWEEA